MKVIMLVLFYLFSPPTNPPGAAHPIVGVYFTALYRALASSRTRLLDHTQWRATFGRNPLNEWSETSTWQHITLTQQTNIRAPGGIRTHDRSRRAAVDLRLRPRGYWDRRLFYTKGQVFPFIRFVCYSQPQRYVCLRRYYGVHIGWNIFLNSENS